MYIMVSLSDLKVKQGVLLDDEKKDVLPGGVCSHFRLLSDLILFYVCLMERMVIIFFRYK